MMNQYKKLNVKINPINQQKQKQLNGYNNNAQLKIYFKIQKILIQKNVHYAEIV